MPSLIVLSFLFLPSVLFALEPMSKDQASSAARAACVSFVHEALQYGVDYATEKKGAMTRPIAEKVVSLVSEMKRALISAKNFEEKEAVEARFLVSMNALIDKDLPVIKAECQKLEAILQKCTAYPEDRGKECLIFEAKKIFPPIKKILIGK